MSLNSDQQKGLEWIVRWEGSPHMYAVLEGKGGCGKTFLMDAVLKELSYRDPLVLAPTNEALQQLREKVTGDYEFRTVDSALGMRPTTHKKELNFEHIALPKFWGGIGVVVLDEASMPDQFRLDLLISTGVKILFVGHGSQLPPIDIKRKILDKCVSPAFNQDWMTFKLTQPMRNTGELWAFNCTVEDMIYDRKIKLPTTFDAKRSRVREFLNDEKGSLLSGDTKMVMWSNAEVDKQNAYLRKGLFGEEAVTNKYLAGDKIILTKPLSLIEGLEFYKPGDLDKLSGSKESIPSLYSNAKATVLGCKEVDVSIHPSIKLKCYKISVECEGERVTFYEPVNESDREGLAEHYEHKAWGYKTANARKKAYITRHFILSCFANVKHYFAATSHRLQGSSVKNIVVMHSDIVRNPCFVEASKCYYVATSRAMDNLLVYRGI